MSQKRHNPMNFFQECRDVNKQRALDRSLVECCESGDIDAVIDLLQKGASPEGEAHATAQMMSGENYKRPLMAAVVNGHKKIAQLLLDNEANPCAGDRYKVQAIHRASQAGHRDCVSLLLDAGADANAETLDFNRPGVYKKPFRGGTTPLHMAAKGNHSECIEELVLHGKANLNQADVIGMTSLSMACQLGHEESILTILRLSEGMKLNTGASMGSGNTPLHDCVRTGLVEASKALLSRGALVNSCTPTGYTPLHFGLIQTNATAPELVKTLVLYGLGIDVNIPNRKGLRPLHLVAFKPNEGTHIHHIHTIEYHMSRDHITRDPGQARRDPELASFLIQYGADPDIEYHNCSLLQQEIYSEDDDTILDTFLRGIDQTEIPARPKHISVSVALAVGASSRVARLKELFSRPRTLQHYCRLLIRKMLTPTRLNRIAEVPLPDSLRDYVLLKT